MRASSDAGFMRWIGYNYDSTSAANLSANKYGKLAKVAEIS